MSQRWILALLLPLSVALVGCSANGSSRSTPQSRAAGTRAQARTGSGPQAGGTRPTATNAPRTTDPGSRFVSATTPVGGIAVETSPLTGGVLALPSATGQPEAGGSDMGYTAPPPPPLRAPTKLAPTSAAPSPATPNPAPSTPATSELRSSAPLGPPPTAVPGQAFPDPDQLPAPRIQPRGQG